MNHALGVAGGAGREQDQRVGVEPRRAREVLVRAGLGGGDDVDARCAERAGRLCGGRLVDDGKSGTRGADDVLDLERGEPRIDRDRAGPQPPDRDELGEELEPVAGEQEDALLGREPSGAEAGDPARDLALDLGAIPATSGEGLDQAPGAQC